MKGKTAKEHVFQALQGQTSCFSANGKHMSLLAHLIPRFEMSRGTKQAESCIPSVCGRIIWVWPMVLIFGQTSHSHVYPRRRPFPWWHGLKALRLKSERSKLLDCVLAAFADLILSHLEQAHAFETSLQQVNRCFFWGVFYKAFEIHSLIEEKSCHKLDACLFSKEGLNSCRRKTQISWSLTKLPSSL